MTYERRFIEDVEIVIDTERVNDIMSDIVVDASDELKNLVPEKAPNKPGNILNVDEAGGGAIEGEIHIGDVKVNVQNPFNPNAFTSIECGERTLAAPSSFIQAMREGKRYEVVHERRGTLHGAALESYLPTAWVRSPLTKRWMGIKAEEVWRNEDGVPRCYACGETMNTNEIERCPGMGVVRKYRCPDQCFCAAADVIAQLEDQWTL